MTQRPRRERGRRAEAGEEAGRASLTFNVSTLLQEPIGSVREYVLELAPIDLEDGRALVSGDARMLRTDGSILVSGELQVEVAETCVICLREYGLPLTLELREEFWPEVDPLSHLPVEVPDEREGFPVVEGHLDLREAVRQYVVMARPMGAHCGADCPGPPPARDVTFRSAAGALRSGDDPARAEETAAAASPIDSRWAALRRLRDEMALDGSAAADEEEI